MCACPRLDCNHSYFYVTTPIKTTHNAYLCISFIWLGIFDLYVVYASYCLCVHALNLFLDPWLLCGAAPITIIPHKAQVLMHLT